MYERDGITIRKIGNGFLVTFPMSHDGLVIAELPMEDQFEIQGQYFMKGAQKEQNKDELLEKLRTAKVEQRKKMLKLQKMENIFFYADEKEMFEAISKQLK